MIVELISVGNELLTGKVANTNAAFLAKECLKLGFDCKYITTIGDYPLDIAKAIDHALKRADILIFTGGLGPTEDDLTVESIAKRFNIPLILDEKIVKHIESLFTKRGLIMPETNIKQALIPKGAIVLDNPIGTAPGILWNVKDLIGEQNDKIIIALPGVPSEMEMMWEQKALNHLKKLQTEYVYERYINFFGISESGLVMQLKDLMDSEDPKILPYANNHQIQLRVFSKNVDKNNAESMVEKVLKIITERMSYNIYGYDDDTLEKAVANRLFEKKLTISLAESCTGGLLSSRLTDIAGSSKYILSNFVTYSNKSKELLLNVPGEVIKSKGAVSKEVAEIICDNVRKNTKTDIGVGITGIAGPDGGTNEKPVGTVYIGISYNGKIAVEKYNAPATYPRQLIKWAFTQKALFMILKILV